MARLTLTGSPIWMALASVFLADDGLELAKARSGTTR